MFENKPVKSLTIWISLLTSLSYLVAVGGIVNAFPLSQNSQRDITQKIATIKQTETELDTEKPVADEAEAEAEVDNTLEKAIISELNRVRTNPQGYADWLENQKQYYQGMLLKLPGEQPIRTNRGLRSLEEAIAFLRQQQELPALSSSTELTSAARQQITAITNNRQARHNLVYGKVTPEAIVMQLVVDDGFPDRPHRLAIFNPNHRNTGIACSEIPVYNNVCAIAYRNTEVARQVEDNSEEKNTDLPTPPEVSSEATTSENSEPEVIITTKPTSQTDIPEEITNNNQTDSNPEPEVTENTALEEQPEGITQSPSDDNIDSEPEVRENTASEEQPESEITQSPPENNIDSESETTATTEETDLDVATSNTNTPSQAVEIIERGTLEEGDDVIPNDGSFYDSYPLEGSAGDSFIITLESEDFDTFLAIMDRDGNIIEQNDDVDEQQSNSRLEITLPNNGTYSIIVNAYEQQGQGSYVLKVSR